MKILKIQDVEPGLKVIGLSGTPFSTSPMNGFSLLNIFAPELLPSESRFMSHFCITQLQQVARGRFALQTVSYKNLRDLKRLVEMVSIRRLAADATGMPDDILIDRPVKIDGRQHELYEEIRQQTIAEIKGEPPSTLHFPAVKLIRLRQVLNNPELVGYYESSAKWSECDTIVDEVLTNPDAKIVIWTEWKDAVEGLVRRYAEFKAFAVTGDTSKEDLARMERDFDENDCRIVVATPFKGGTGINWLARARTAIWIERIWSLVNYQQALRRLSRRIGQAATTAIDRIKSEPSRQLFIHASGTVDDLVLKTLTNHSNMADAVATPDEVLHRLNRDEVIAFLERHG